MIGVAVSDREHPPRRLADRFVVEARLGEGAMGQVFRVFDEHQGRTVALKLLKPERTEPGQLQRFKREFRAAARLDHPYCVRSHEWVERDGLAMLTMEYVPGGPLALHRWEHAIDVARLALQLLAGLDHIHGKRIVHRDLKPSNILVEPTAGPPHPRLTDFGIADVVELSHEDTAVGLVQGSLRYLAPETLESGVADPRSDLYSLGLILYGLLAGQHPFGGTNRSLRQWLSVHRRGRMRSLTQVRPDVPGGLIALVHQLCHRQPQERFVDAATAHDALAELWVRWPAARPLPPAPPLVRRPYLAAPAFVGRTTELQTLQTLHASSREGEGPHVVRVVGDAGQGKSRLLRELLVEVLDGDTMVFPGTCRAEGSNPYEPLGDLLEALADVELDGDETPVHSVHAVGAQRGLAGPDDPTADVELGSSQSPSSMVAELRPQWLEPEDAVSGRLQAHARWSARMRLLCRKRPVLLLLEDAQWADPPTLQLLTAMVRAMVVAREKGDSVRAAFVISHRRSSDNPDLDALLEVAQEYGALTSLDLPPLPGEGATAVLASMLMMPVQDVPASFGPPLVAQAEGNPLFLAQMLHSLLGRGQLQRGPDGRWQLDARELSAARLPGSVNRAIGERAARLATEHKQIMVAAAVLGRQFEVGPLASVTELEELLLLDGLDELVRAGFVEDHGPGYRFVHDRIRESILEAVPTAELRRLHARAATHLVEHEGQLPSAWPTIAYHFEQAHDDARAVEYSLRAARQASLEHADGAALACYLTVLRAAERGGIAVDDEIWELQGDAHTALGHYTAAVEAFTRRLEGLREAHERAGVSSKLGLIEFKQGNYHRAIAVLQGVLSSIGLRRARVSLPPILRLLAGVVASLLPLPRWRGSVRQAEVAIRTHALLAECYFMSGDPMSTSYHSIAASNTARRLGPNPESVRALALHGFGMVLYGQTRLGQRLLQQARAYCREIDAPESVRCRLHVSEALAAFVRGEVAIAIEGLEDAWRRFGAAASAEARVHVLITITQVLLLAGREQRRCEHYIRRMQALAEELNDARTLGMAYQQRGYLLACEGQLGAAIEPLRRGRRLSGQLGDRPTELRAQDLLIVALALTGELDESLELGRGAAERSLTESGYRSYMCRDAGLVIAAAEAVRRGLPLPVGIEPLVRRVLRHRRREALALPTAAPLFLVAEAAWREVQGQHHDFTGPLAAAELLGLRGEAALGRVVAERFGAARARPRDAEPRALDEPPTPR
jgi:tetratricopeptide (TPR) repeat protein